MAVAQELTGSPLAYLGHLDAAGRDEVLATSVPGPGACRIPPRDAAMGHGNREVRSLWRAVLHDGQSMLTNDPAAHPDWRGMPQGHPPITAFWAFP